MTLKRDIFIYVGLFFLVLGVFVSVTVPSLFHILAAIPLLLHFFKNFSEIKLPKSSIFLILLVFWGYISNFANFNDLNDVMRSFGKQKYIIFSILSLIAFPYFFKNYMTQKRIAFLIKTFFFTVIAACIVGIIKSRFGFDLVKFKSIVAIGRSEGFTEIMRYGYGTGFVVSLLTGALLYKSKVKNFISYKWLALAFVFGAVGMLESKCRGAILGTFCSIPFILYFKNKKLGVISFIVAFVSVLSIAAVVIFGGSSKSRMFQKLASPSNLIRFSQ